MPWIKRRLVLWLLPEIRRELLRTQRREGIDFYRVKTKVFK